MESPTDIVVLTDEQVQELMTPKESLSVLEQAFRDLGTGKGVTRPRSRTYVGTRRPGAVYQFVCMDGGSSELGYFGLRLLSHLRYYPGDGGSSRAATVTSEGKKRFAGLVLVFDLEDGALVGLLPNSTLSRLRVGATSALAARYLARTDSRVLGIIGSGPQAVGHALAFAPLYPLRQITVYSPNPDHRRQFVETVTKETGIEVIAAESAREAAACDILITATNAIGPVYAPEWVQPGTCVISINQHEVPQEMDQRADLVVVKGKQRGLNFASDEVGTTPEMEADAGADWEGYPDLADLVTGKAAGRTGPEQITLFRNNEGLGLAFAAVGARACQIARQWGVGHRIPRDWFTVDRPG